MPESNQSTGVPNVTNKKITLINQAREILRGDRNLNGAQMEAMYKELEYFNQFAYATEVLLVKMRMDEDEGKTLQLSDYHKLALYIYKDHSLPSAFKFKKALQQLQNHDELAKTVNCESLGLAGAIFKRKWQYDHQFKNLILSRYYYKRGYTSWMQYLDKPVKSTGDIQNDDGYTAINYAFINELMAVDKLEEHGEITGSSESIDARFKEAEDVRQFILQQFLTDITAANPVVKQNNYPNWVLCTIAEAYFGLRKYEPAKQFIEKYIQAVANEPWQIQTFNQQLFSVAYLQEARKKFYINHPSTDADEQKRFETIIAEINTAKVYECLLLFSEQRTGEKDSENKAGVPEIKKSGKLGLALSGGGFRASFFQIGVLAALAEKDELRNVEVLSCVSGGSIIGAYYYIKLKKLLEEKADAEIDKNDYIKIVQDIEEDFLSGVQKNLRVRIFCDPVSNIRMVLDKNYSRTHRLGELYEKFLYRKIWNKKELYMNDLFITAKDESKDFDISIDNWKRKNKIPQLILNATSVNTGHNWQFTASWMGEPPGNIQPDIDVKPRLRRMYYNEAPDGYKKFRLGYAVGASSCVPVMFHPMPMYNLYPGIDLQLIDGGLHDNQGIAALIEQECSNMIISDGSGQLPTNNAATNNEAAVFYRADNILQERLRELQFMDLSERNYTAQLSQLITVHLKNDLPQNPMSWNYCMDPVRTVSNTIINQEGKELTKYEMLKSVQTLLSQIRTDLDSFNDTEAYALMYSGYLQTHFEHNKKNNIAAPVRDEASWKFSAIKAYATIPVRAAAIKKILTVASNQFLKIVQLSSVVRYMIYALLAAAGVIGIYFIYQNWDTQITRLKVGGAVVILLIFLAAKFSKVLGYLVDVKGELKKKIFILGLVLVGFFVSIFYLFTFNWLYNRMGKVKKIRDTP